MVDGNQQRFMNSMKKMTNYSIFFIDTIIITEAKICILDH